MNLIAALRGLVLAALLVPFAQAGELPRPVAAALEAARIPPEHVAVWVQAVDEPFPALAANADRPMNPASVMKLVTAFAAFERLGPAHTWTTRVASVGTVRDGVLEGDLYLAGGGDPMLSFERTWRLLRRIRALGVNEVRGDIVLDGSVLRLPDHDPSAFDGQGLRPYNSGAWGLMLHYNTVQLTLVPGEAPGAPVAVAADPPLRGLSIDNRLVSSARNCEPWYRDLSASVESDPAGARLVLTGSLPSSCGRRDWSAAPLSPQQFATAMVAQLWAELGGKVQGTVRVGTTPPVAQLMLTETSPPLSEVVREMNKWSSNVIARQLLASMGALDRAAPDMVVSGALVARAMLAAADIDISGLVIENGAGLSRIERIRADTLGQLLLTAWQRPYMPEFMAALPVAGVDGTARRRLVDSPVRGRAHLKTGTVDGVRAIAGYVLDRQGHRHAVVMLVNHPRAAASQAAQDALIEWVWRGS